MQTTTFRRNVALAISSILLALSFIAALSFFSAAAVNVGADTGSEISTVAVKDTYVNINGQSGTNYKKRNYGASTEIRINKYNRAYLQFETTEMYSEELTDRTLSLCVHTTTDISGIAMEQLNLSIAKNKDNDKNDNTNWIEGTLTGTVPSPDDGSLVGNNAATILPGSEDNSKTLEYNAEEKILKVNFPASYIKDTNYDQYDSVNNKHYITVYLWINNKTGTIEFYFYSKEDSNAAHKAPTLVLSAADSEEPVVPEHLYEYEEGASVAVKDTFVNINGASPKTYNFGGDTTVYINRYRRAYMQFETTALRDGIDGKYLSLYLNTVEDIANIDFTKISFYAIKNVKTDVTANFDWVEGTMSGTAPTEDDGSITGNNVGDILPRLRVGDNYVSVKSIYRHYDSENKVLRIDFPASVIADENFAQYDSENEKYYFTLMLMIPDEQGMPGFHFYSKEGETAARFAPYIMLKDKALSIAQASVTLNDALTVNYYVTAEGYFANDALMLFTVAEGERECAAVETEEDHVYKFSLRLTPQLMAENVVAQYIDGETVIAEHSNFSVKTYLTALYNADGATAKVRTLVADLLAYGEAAKDYIGFESETAINDNATIAASATEFVAPEESAKAKTGEALENARFSGVTLLFDNVNKIGFKVAATDASAITVKVDGVALTATDLGNGVFVYLTDGIFANCFDNEISATMYLAEDDTEGETVTFSVNSYVYEIVASSENEKMITLAKALYNYGKAVTAYLAV